MSTGCGSRLSGTQTPCFVQRPKGRLISFVGPAVGADRFFLALSRRQMHRSPEAARSHCSVSSPQIIHSMTVLGSTTLTSSLPLIFRSARPADGTALWQLAQAAGTLEVNSQYFYLLLATDFGDTCLVAEHNGQAVGMVIGYQPPREPATAFVWQVGVLPLYQGQGVG